MLKYNVNITDDALVDMEDIYNYIAHELLAPENARGQYDRIANIRFIFIFISGNHDFAIDYMMRK